MDMWMPLMLLVLLLLLLLSRRPLLSPSESQQDTLAELKICLFSGGQVGNVILTEASDGHAAKAGGHAEVQLELDQELVKMEVQEVGHPSKCPACRNV